MRVELADEVFEGLATDVTPEGHLVVEAGGAPRTVVAGDVVHVRTTRLIVRAPAVGPGHE